MAPRGSLKAPWQIGCVVKRESSESRFYRVQVSLTLLGVKKTVHGPLHRSMAMAKSDLECARMASSQEAMGGVLRALQAEWKRRRADQVRAAAEALTDNVGKGETAREWSAPEHANCSSGGIMSSSGQEDEVVPWSPGSGGMVSSAPVIARGLSEVLAVTAIANEMDVKDGDASGQA